MATKGEQMYQDIVKMLVYECPQANVEIVQRKVMETLRHMARETCLLQTSLLPRLYDHVSVYDLEENTPKGYEISEIIWVKLNGCCINPIDECKLCVSGYSMVSDDCIELHDAQIGCEPYALEVKVAMVPCYDVCHIAKPFVKHYDLIKDMTSAMLLDMPKKPWSDSRAADRLKRTTSALLNELASKVNRRHTPTHNNHLLSTAI